MVASEVACAMRSHPQFVLSQDRNTHIRTHTHMYAYDILFILHMVVDQNSFIPERPFFANKNFTFAKLSRTPCLSFAGPMLANNTSYEDSFTTCQITPENYGSLLGNLLNMQLASRNLFSGQIVCKDYWPTPFNMHFDFRPLFRITFAELSRKYPYSQTPAISRGCTEGKAIFFYIVPYPSFSSMPFSLIYICCSFWGGILSVVFPIVAISF